MDQTAGGSCLLPSYSLHHCHMRFVFKIVGLLYITRLVACSITSVFVHTHTHTHACTHTHTHKHTHTHTRTHTHTHIHTHTHTHTHLPIQHDVYEPGSDTMDVWFDSGSSWATLLKGRVRPLLTLTPNALHISVSALPLQTMTDRLMSTWKARTSIVAGSSHH